MFTKCSYRVSVATSPRKGYRGPPALPLRSAGAFYGDLSDANIGKTGGQIVCGVRSLKSLEKYGRSFHLSDLSAGARKDGFCATTFEIGHANYPVYIPENGHFERGAGHPLKSTP
jgi:hypothetical protein